MTALIGEMESKEWGGIIWENFSNHPLIFKLRGGGDNDINMLCAIWDN
jgi:hypothetical protein